MNASRRRGMSLIQVIAMLPVMAAVATIQVRMLVRVFNCEKQAGEWQNMDAVCRDLARRTQTDAREAIRATLGTDTSRPELSLLMRDGRRITYHAIGGQVTRTEQSANAAPIQYAWRVDGLSVSWKLEQASDHGQIVWIRMNYLIISAGRADGAWSMAAAASVRGGGAQ